MSTSISRQGKPNVKRAATLACCAWFALAAACAGAQASAAAVQPLTATPSATRPYAACAPQPAGVASCQAVIVPAGAKLDSLAVTGAAPADSGIDGSGLAPADLQSAYKLPSSTAGSGQTVAIVDAYNDPTAESDLAAYRSAYGLPACTSANGCFEKVNQTGGKTYPPQPTSEEGDWPVEESLDVDMVSAVCPNCHIALVEANSAGMEDLGAAEDEAATLGTEISNSWGSFEFSGETAYDSYFDHPGIPVTVASGDYSYDNEQYSAGVPSYPAASPDVIAVGGTELTPAENSRGWSETVWPRSGSGCSHYEPKPSYQKDSGCSKRTTNDVAAAAESISIYDTSGAQGEKLSGWLTVGGTSAATPIIASYEALSSSTVRSEGAAAFYKNTSDFFPVTTGSNGSCGGSYLCTGGSGYRGPTGVGTPDGVIGGSGPAPKLEVSSVSPANGATAGGTSVTIKGADFVKGATVKIGKAASSVVVRSESEITAVTAAGPAGADEVVVTDEHGTSSGGPSFTYVAPPAPAVTSISPSEGSTHGATTVTIKGSGFTASSKVTIGSKAGSVDVLSEHEIVAVTGKDSAGAAEVVVSDANGTSSGGPSFTYVAPPVPAVSSISPTSGSTVGGTTVKIKGSGFTSGSKVTIGRKASDVEVLSEHEIVAVTAKGSAGSEEAVVSNADGTSSGGPSFTYIAPPAPVVRSISPSEGPTTGGTTVTVTGANFLAGATVKIGGKALAVTVVSATEITATTPSVAARSDEVIVTDAGESSSDGPLFTYKKVPPAAVSEVKLTCASAGGCSGALALTVTAAGQSSTHASDTGGAVAAAVGPSRFVKAKGHGRSLAPAVRAIGVGAYALASGQSATVKLALNAAGRALLRATGSHRGVGVTLTVRSAGEGEQPAQTYNVRLDLVRRSHGPGGLERSAAAPSGGLAAVSVGAA